MSLAYLLKAHKNPEQVLRAIQRFWFDGALFLLTLDRYADLRSFQRVLSQLPSHIPVYWIHPRDDGRWCGPGLVRSSLRAIEFALGMANPPEQILQISGQCYPIKPIQQIRDYFAGLGDRFVLECKPPPIASWDDRGWYRIERYHYCLPRWLPFDQEWRVFPPDQPPQTWKAKCLHKWLSWRFPMPRVGPAGIETRFGHAFWSLSRGAAKYVLDFHRAHPELYAFHKNTYVVDEVYIQTIIGTFEYWLERSTQSAIHYCDWSKPHPPQILTMQHRDVLRSTACLTARKFDVTVDAEILDWIDANLLEL